MGPPWYGKLDLLATDYYPAKDVPHPDSGLPWQYAPGLDKAYAAAIEADMEQYAALSKYVVQRHFWDNLCDVLDIVGV